jgi:hypothetical protein
MQSYAPSLTTFGPQTGSPDPSRRRAVLERTALSVAFAVAGTILLGLTFAATIVVPLAGRQGIVLSGHELATAARLGSIWWLFALGVVTSFGAALAMLGQVLQHLSDPLAD